MSTPNDWYSVDIIEAPCEGNAMEMKAMLTIYPDKLLTPELIRQTIIEALKERGLLE